MMAAIPLLLVVLTLGNPPAWAQVQAVSTARTAIQSAGAKPAPAQEGPTAPPSKQTAPSASGKEATSQAAGSTGRGRDPFKIPNFAARAEQAAPNLGPLPPGKRGLVIGQLSLKGIVRIDPTNVMIAVVTNYANRAYFLREQDVLFNGVVTKIMPDAVYFTENYLDPYGRLQAREVVRRLGQGPGEAR